MTALLQLYVIRHGETAWSITGQHTGRTVRVIARVCTLAGHVALFSHGQFARVLSLWNATGTLP